MSKHRFGKVAVRIDLRQADAGPCPARSCCGVRQGYMASWPFCVMTCRAPCSPPVGHELFRSRQPLLHRLRLARFRPGGRGETDRLKASMDPSSRRPKIWAGGKILKASISGPLMLQSLRNAAMQRFTAMCQDRPQAGAQKSPSVDRVSREQRAGVSTMIARIRAL